MKSAPILAASKWIQEREGEMSLWRPVFKRNRIANESRFENLGESSVDALRRVEAECDWSDAALLLAELRLEPRQTAEPPAQGG
jgi:hypothetical protein